MGRLEDKVESEVEAQEVSWFIGKVVIDVEQQRLGSTWLSITFTDDEGHIRERWTNIRVSEGDTLTVDMKEMDVGPQVSKAHRATKNLLDDD